jgi:hypothetical protein
MDVDQLASRRRDPEPRELPELVAVPGVEKCEQRVREMAAVLTKNPGSVSHWVSTGAERPPCDHPCRERHEVVIPGRTSTAGGLERFRCCTRR